jgi:hypothetical protein
MPDYDYMLGGDSEDGSIPFPDPDNDLAGYAKEEDENGFE